MAITPLKTKFGKLIRDYLRNAEIRQNDLAAKLKVSGSAVSQMLHGKIVPNQQQLATICELLMLDRAQAFELQSMLSGIRTGAENMPFPLQPDHVRPALPARADPSAAGQPFRHPGFPSDGVRELL